MENTRLILGVIGALVGVLNITISLQHNTAPKKVDLAISWGCFALMSLSYATAQI